MKIDNFKDLENLIKLCRKQGIDSIKIDGIELEIGPAPERVYKTKSTSKSNTNVVHTPGGITDDTQIITSDLTEEQLMFYSAQPHDTGSM